MTHTINDALILQYSTLTRTKILFIKKVDWKRYTAALYMLNHGNKRTQGFSEFENRNIRQPNNTKKAK